MIWYQPNYKDLENFARDLGCDWLGNIRCIPDASCEENTCHSNVKNYILSHKGKQILGYYFLESAWGYQAILHSVWKDNNGNLIDITPFADKRKLNVFASLRNNKEKYKANNIYSQFLDKYKQETDIMFYVYALIDPRNEMPFYIGKGKGRRAKTHLWEIPETRNQHKENKIAAIRAVGLEPRIEYLAEGLIDEEFAYKMESDLILRYGRKGYEPWGILTNVCLDSRPPNHKGKSYEQIYGPEKAQTQRKIRSDLQKSRGGYGPKKHTEETKKKISNSSKGENNGMYGKKHTIETIRKIKNNRKLPIGQNHHNSKSYKLKNEFGEIHILHGGELIQFCNENNLSYATFKKNISLNWPPSKKGKNKGWEISLV